MGPKPTCGPGVYLSAFLFGITHLPHLKTALEPVFAAILFTRWLDVILAAHFCKMVVLKLRTVPIGPFEADLQLETVRCKTETPSSRFTSNFH